MTMTHTWDPDHRSFLADHLWAVLATGRADGSPQQSMIGYAVDDDGPTPRDAKSYTAKWKNAVRQPRVSVTVPDGRAHLVIYGEAETIDADPLRAELTSVIFAAMSGTDPMDPAALVDSLNEQQRTVLRITPSKTLFMG